MLKKIAIIMGVIGLLICCVDMENTWSQTSLTNGVALNSNVGERQEKYYTIGVPSGATNLEVNLYNLDNDADLYVKYNSLSDSIYDCQSYQWGTAPETCIFNNPINGIWHIVVRGYSPGTTSYTIKATCLPNITNSPSQWVNTSNGIYYDLGNVGIGTASPKQDLEIYDEEHAVLRLTGGASNHSTIQLYGPSNTGWAIIHDRPAGLFRINRDTRENYGTRTDLVINDATGNVGIGTTSPSNKLHVAGDAMANHWYTPSDSRLKENITPLTNAIEKVSALRGIYFNLKGESALTPLLIEAVKELKKQNEELKARIEALENR